MGVTRLIKSAIGLGVKSGNKKRKKIKIRPMSEKERQDNYQVFLKDITRGRRKSKNNYRRLK